MMPKPFLEIRMPTLEETIARYCEDKNIQVERRLGNSIIRPTHLSAYFFFEQMDSYEKVYQSFQDEIDTQWDGTYCAKAS